MTYHEMKHMKLQWDYGEGWWGKTLVVGMLSHWFGFMPEVLIIVTIFLLIQLVDMFLPFVLGGFCIWYLLLLLLLLLLFWTKVVARSWIRDMLCLLGCIKGFPWYIFIISMDRCLIWILKQRSCILHLFVGDIVLFHQAIEGVVARKLKQGKRSSKDSRSIMTSTNWHHLEFLDEKQQWWWFFHFFVVS